MATKNHRSTLGDYFTLQRGTTYKSRLLGEPGPVLLGLASINRNGGFRKDSLRTYGGESPAKLLVAPGALYLSLKDVTQSADLLGAVARLPLDHPPGRLTQDTVKLEPKGNNVPLDYLYWLLRTPQYRNYCRAHATGTTNLGLAREDFLAFPAPEPTSIQRQIVKVLGALEEKIELNRRMIETLEAIARALFKSWFVDFDLTRAHASGRASSLPKEITDAFPSRFEDSEQESIPSGWEIRSLYECAEYINGSAFRNDHFSPRGSGLPIIKIGELKEGITDRTRFTEVALEPKYRITAGEILFSWSGSPDTSIDTFVWVGEDGWLNQHIFKIQFKRPEEKYFVYFLLRHFKAVFVETARNKQTTGLGHVTGQDLKRLKTVFPSDDALRVFNQVSGPIFQRCYSSRLESRTLTALRNTLLPELIADDVRVNQAERAVESAT